MPAGEEVDVVEGEIVSEQLPQRTWATTADDVAKWKQGRKVWLAWLEQKYEAKAAAVLGGMERRLRWAFDDYCKAHRARLQPDLVPLAETIEEEVHGAELGLRHAEVEYELELQHQ